MVLTRIQEAVLPALVSAVTDTAVVIDRSTLKTLLQTACRSLGMGNQNKPQSLPIDFMTVLCSFRLLSNSTISLLFVVDFDCFPTDQAPTCTTRLLRLASHLLVASSIDEPFGIRFRYFVVSAI